MKELRIRWQRLVSNGQTCQRCSSTESEVERAALALRRSLAGLGIEVTLEKRVIEPEVFAGDALESNRIWIGGESIEELLGARTAQSLCCGPCGDTECRTVELEGTTYETITADLIIRAGLVAASRLLASEDGGEGEASACCAGPDGKPPPAR